MIKCSKKERAARTGGNSIMEERLAWLVIITYMSFKISSNIKILIFFIFFCIDF